MLKDKALAQLLAAADPFVDPARPVFALFDGAGRHLGTIKVPRQPANAAFGGPDKRALYITAREGLYRLKMLSQGPDRIGK